MNKTKTLLLAGLLSAGFTLTATAQKTFLNNEHVDVGVAFEDGEWDLHIHDETNDREFEPGDAVLRVGGLARTTVPADPAYAFLGRPGSTVWILPAVQNADLLFLGIGAEELEPGIFVNDTVRLHLKRVRGPGRKAHFAVYTIDAFGTPVVGMNTRDGLTEADAVDVPAGGHTDYNWAFSAPGRYRVTFEATGTLLDGTVVSSGDVTYTFHVVRRTPPQP